MDFSNEGRACLFCKKNLKGRSDKKFCDDYCRASYNNEQKIATNSNIRNINKTLAKNRRILEGILPSKEQLIKIPRERLLEKGFQFRYITHTYTNQKGNVYFFCYEYGYLPLENNWLLIVKRKEDDREP